MLYVNGGVTSESSTGTISRYDLAGTSQQGWVPGSTDTTNNTPFSISNGGRPYGMAVDDAGFLYVVWRDTGNYYILKLDFPAETIVDAIQLNVSGIPFSVGYDGYNDLLFRDGELYLLNQVWSGTRNTGSSTNRPAVLRFSTEPLAYTDGFGTADPTADGSSTTGQFLNPRRFVAVLNRRILIADEAASGDSDDRVVYFESYRTGSWAGWGTYGSHGTGNDEFQLFIGS
jgi:hypothetical protein